MYKRILFLLVLIVSLASCSDKDVESTVDTKTWNIDSNVDTSYRPGDNFYMYGIGSWYKNTTDLGEYGLKSFFILDMPSLQIERYKNLDKPAENRFFNAFNTLDADSTKAMNAINNNLKLLDNIQTKTDAWVAIGKLMELGYNYPFQLITYCRGGKIKAVFAPTKLIAASGEYLLQDISSEGGIKSVLTNDSNEKQTSRYNRYDLSPSNLEKHPEINKAIVPYRSLCSRSFDTGMIDKIAETLGINIDDIYYYSDAGIDSTMNVINNYSVETIKELLKTCILNDIKYVSNYNLQKYNKEKGTSYTLDDLEDKVYKSYAKYLISYQFAQKYVNTENKEKIKAICNEFKSVLASRISGLDWMSATTKQYALEKLEAMAVNVGCPDEWITEAIPSFNNSSALENLMEARKCFYQLSRKLIGKVTSENSLNQLLSYGSRSLNEMNAFYNPSSNCINILPVFLNAPLFDESMSDAYNYSIYMVVGHEITHGFDSMGYLYDKYGDLNNWWTDSDKNEFQSRLQKLVNCYNQFEIMPDVAPGEYANGTATLGENVADLGGTNIAYQAYVNKLIKDGYNGDELIKQKKRFFLGLCNLWRLKFNLAGLRLLQKSDRTHSLGKERVNGVVMNMDEWYDLFDVKPGDKMYLKPEDRIHIW